MKAESKFAGIAESPLRKWWSNERNRAMYVRNGFPMDMDTKVLDWLLVTVEGISPTILADEDLCENPQDFDYGLNLRENVEEEDLEEMADWRERCKA